jgi:hypothetical protein
VKTESFDTGWLQVKCHRCETEASIPLDAVRRPRVTPIWKLEAALKCRSCRTPRYSPRVHMIKLTQQREIAPYKWAHPDDDERRYANDRQRRLVGHSFGAVVPTMWLAA